MKRSVNDKPMVLVCKRMRQIYKRRLNFKTSDEHEVNKRPPGFRIRKDRVGIPKIFFTYSIENISYHSCQMYLLRHIQSIFDQFFHCFLPLILTKAFETVSNKAVGPVHNLLIHQLFAHVLHSIARVGYGAGTNLNSSGVTIGSMTSFNSLTMFLVVSFRIHDLTYSIKIGKVICIITLLETSTVHLLPHKYPGYCFLPSILRGTSFAVCSYIWRLKVSPQPAHMTATTSKLVEAF